MEAQSEDTTCSARSQRDEILWPLIVICQPDLIKNHQAIRKILGVSMSDWQVGQHTERRHTTDVAGTNQ